MVTVSVLLASALLAPGLALAEEEGPTIAEIVLEGGVTLTLDTVYYYLGLEPGDPLDQKSIAKGFQSLWDSGLFEDVRIEVEPVSETEVKLRVIVVERPFVSSVVFEGNKKISSTTLKDKLDEKGVELPRNVPLRMTSLARIQTVIQEIYAEEGRRSARVRYRVEVVSPKERRVVFTINEGGKVKIRDVDFVGNDVFTDRRLRRVLKKVKKVKLYRLWGKKVIFFPESWDEDRDNLRHHYMNFGYKDVKVGEPELEVLVLRPEKERLSRQKHRMMITIPVEEGEAYAVGSIRVEGAKLFDPERLKTLFQIQPGSTYSYQVIETGMEAIRDFYHNQGYIYAYTNQILTDREGEDHVVDVVVDVFEGDRFRLGRLEFKGNTRTNDKVLRREFRISEGDYMAMGVFRASVFKVNALGYWKLEEDPLEFEFDEEEDIVNVTVKGTEVGRNDIQFGAGYSELDGFFAQAQFNTRNFLGRGETLGLSLQSGRRVDTYSLNFTEPYLFDRRIILGSAIYKTNVEIADFYRETTGSSLTTGLGFGNFSSFSALLSYEDVFSRYAVSRGGLVGDDTGGHRPPLDLPPEIDVPLTRTYERYTGKTMSLTPAYGFDSRDDPFDPNRGKRFSLRSRLAGGPLGGDFDYLRPEMNFSMFISVTKKTVFAFNVEGGQFFAYDDSELPLYERYRLGGERTLRGIPYYTVLPRDPEGNYFLTKAGSRMGGDRYWLFNLEYQFRVGGPVKLVLFSDNGNTYHETQGWEVSEFRRTAGIEMRIFLPIFQAPIRFIYGYNLDPWPDEDTSDFQFSIGTTF